MAIYSSHSHYLLSGDDGTVFCDDLLPHLKVKAFSKDDRSRLPIAYNDHKL